VNSVFVDADTTNAGSISRSILRVSLENQAEKAVEIFGGNQTQNQSLLQKAKRLKKYFIDENGLRELPIKIETISSIMRDLEHVENGLISQSQVVDAIN
jgi:hypothetical protein